MKKWSLIAAVLFTSASAQSQTFNEWFRQKKTQVSYLAQQIAALQAYTQAIEKGYAIAQDGLTFISDVKQGDFSLHLDHFVSFGRVSPAIQSYSKVALIVTLAGSVPQRCSEIRKLLSKTSAFTTQTRTYGSLVLEKLLIQCQDRVDELSTLLTSGALQLRDDERLARIDDIYDSLKIQNAFAQRFQSDIGLMSLQFRKEGQDAAGTRLLYGMTGK